MAGIVDSYIQYIATVRRYSTRTQSVYREVLNGFISYSIDGEADTDDVVQIMKPNCIRNYEVHLLDEKNDSARTANLHLSVLSGFAKYLMRNGLLKSNPVHLVSRPKVEKRLPEFYRQDAMDDYFERTKHSASVDELELLESFGQDSGSAVAKEMYERRLRRLIVSLLHGTAMRRAELISLDCSSLDSSRRVMKVRGKGDKVREIPVVGELCDEIALYQRAVASALGMEYESSRPLLLTWKGSRLYPVFVDRAIKEELGSSQGITGRKSPHVLRHTLATELLNDGADLNSIKEFLGHASLAATQVYTHNSIEKLKSVYENAHPRAKEK